MASATSFVFDSYRVEGNKRTINFTYSIRFGGAEPINLIEQLVLPVDIVASDPVISRLLASLHIGLGISYYKTFLPPILDLNNRQLSVHEAAFWNDVYLNGLGEFLYTNQLEPSRLAKFAGTGSDTPAPSASHNPEAILALGGGKDSIVVGELLKKMNMPLVAFVLGTGDHAGQTAAVAKDMGLELLGVQRRLDPKILELNKRSDTYNGHVPISMAFALTGLVLAAANSKKYLVVGNEASASIPSTTWKGLSINHQWSKSFEFEKSLQAFVRSSISPDLWYFSAIRPLSSVAVAKLFAKHPMYLSDFTSCNRVFVMDPAKRPKGHWCGQCAKCLSSFIILAPWLDEAKLVEIFGKNMLDDAAQADQFLALMGLEGIKPLDCVGTEEEMILSLNLIDIQHKFASSQLIQLAKQRDIIQPEDWDTKLRASLLPAPEEAFPPDLATQLLETMKSELA